ncbi:MAG: DUF2752 domain-containing protein [Phycisphaeraceae bacterium]
MSEHAPSPTPNPDWPLGRRLRYWLTFPVIASMVRSRAMCAGFVGFIGLQVGLSAAGLTLMDCYLLKHTGVPCPGCGLTRGAVASATLDLEAVLYYNALGPAALLVMTLLLLGLLLPERPRDAFAETVERVERATAVSAVVLLGLWVYWLARLIWFGRELGERLSVHIF